MIPNFLRKKDEPRWVFIFKVIGITLLGIIGIGALAILFGYAVMWLWNWLLPGLFGFKTITFWQGIGIIVLAKLLFGSFNHGHSRSHHTNYKCKDHARKKWFEKWEYYDDYWKEEGENAFNTYVENKKAQP